MHYTNPSFNGTNPGCDGGSCHNLEDGLVSATVTDFEVQITVSGTTSKVAGELVDANGTVVAFNNSTSNNPFTLTAPAPGIYTVNAGFKSPNPRRWDSVMVNISVTDVGENKTNPTTIKLYDNFPNPFNPATRIQYTISNTQFVSLKVYDILGNEIATIVNEEKQPGTYEVEFNAQSHSGEVRNLTSGIYFYQIQAGSFTQTRKMILMK
ncbi:MAG: T9SS type A sorting domain-containing protein [Ignavibacteriaceae bacterium]|nr:T9SS type A sorting domain-containing protein [Ignavibacteriaceae bacterium]